jgi:hypothetical protein
LILQEKDSRFARAQTSWKVATGGLYLWQQRSPKPALKAIELGPDSADARTAQ